MKNARINKLKLIIVILIGVICIRTMISIGNFLLTEEDNKNISNKNVSIMKETKKVEATKHITPKSTIKPTKKIASTSVKKIVKTQSPSTDLKNYSNWCYPKVILLENYFNTMTLHSSQNDMIAVMNDFDKLFILEKEFKNKKCPEEFKTFKSLMKNMFAEWHKVENSLLLNDSNGVAINGTKANNYLNKATTEYKKVMGVK